MSRTSAEKGGHDQSSHTGKPSERQQGESGQPHLHGFLAHLFGLDHDHGHDGHGHSTGAHAHFPRSSIWVSALKGMKLSHLFEGLHFTTNCWQIVLFLGFIAYLFVIYWIRHHDPLASEVMGNRVMQGDVADQRIVDATKVAIPIKSSYDTGSIYVPSSQLQGFAAPLPGQAFAGVPAPQANVELGAARYDVGVKAPEAPTFFASNAPQTLAASGNDPYLRAPNFVNHAIAPVPLSQSAPLGAAFNIPELSPERTRLKTIVNR
jgi:hypothetical protein